MTSRSTFQQKALNFCFALFRTFVLPWKRTPAVWAAIIFNREGQIAVSSDGLERRLPSGEVNGEGPVLSECLSKLNLAKIDFSPGRPFRLIDTAGRGGESITLYFLGELLGPDQGVAQEFVHGITYVERSSVRSLIPKDVEEKLAPGH